MFQHQIKSGRVVAIITANEFAGPFSTRLYINDGATATLHVRKAKTLRGAEKQARKMIESHTGKPARCD